mmetsp:Transcript_5457/g.19920  ORF Transcript_5457/g.19920 Transcript_5457/m.19920 type:complete len:200 (-) Transcript_5457:207-806(-)
MGSASRERARTLQRTRQFALEEGHAQNGDLGGAADVGLLMTKTAVTSPVARGGLGPPSERTLTTLADSGVSVCDRCQKMWAGLRELQQHGIDSSARAKYTRCDMVAHQFDDDSQCFLVAHGKVYNATPVLDMHPGGRMSIVRKRGQFCSRDYDFHSPKGQQLWGLHVVGTITPCEQAESCIQSALGQESVQPVPRCTIM